MNQQHNQQHRRILLAIRQRRESLFYSQEYLAVKLQISQNSYSKMEIAGARMSMHRFLRICEILQVTPLTLLNS